MDAMFLSHVPLAKAEPGSLVLVRTSDGDGEQYFAIAVHRAGEPFAARLVSLRADRGALRAIRTDFSDIEPPERLVLSLGRRFTVEPNLFEHVRTDCRDRSALRAGDLLVHDVQQLLVVALAKDAPPLVLDLTGGEVTELSAPSVAVITHWSICVRNGDGQRICLVDTKSHRHSTGQIAAGLPLQAAQMRRAGAEGVDAQAG
jgi:hypothetical protein